MKVADLKKYEDKKDLMLYCPLCHGEYSTTPGDYWAISPHTSLDCCGQAMLLVRKVTTFEEIIEPDSCEECEAFRGVWPNAN